LNKVVSNHILISIFIGTLLRPKTRTVFSVDVVSKI